MSNNELGFVLMLSVKCLMLNCWSANNSKLDNSSSHA